MHLARRFLAYRSSGRHNRQLEVDMKKSSKSRLVTLGRVSRVTRAVLPGTIPEFGSETFHYV